MAGLELSLSVCPAGVSFFGVGGCPRLGFRGQTLLRCSDTVPFFLRDPAYRLSRLASPPTALGSARIGPLDFSSHPFNFFRPRLTLPVSFPPPSCRACRSAPLPVIFPEPPLLLPLTSFCLLFFFFFMRWATLACEFFFPPGLGWAATRRWSLDPTSFSTESPLPPFVSLWDRRRELVFVGLAASGTLQFAFHFHSSPAPPQSSAPRGVPSVPDLFAHRPKFPLTLRQPVFMNRWRLPLFS